jgi:hypothetical protein
MGALVGRPWVPRVVVGAGTFQRLDKVRLASGQVLIVTGYHPNRPANCYSGVLEKGQGKEYVFGAKHGPVKVGAVDEGHPALLNREARYEARGVQQGVRKHYVDSGVAAVLGQLAKAVDGGDVSSAQAVLVVLRGMVPGL